MKLKILKYISRKDAKVREAAKTLCNFAAFFAPLRENRFFKA
jgi:hypothetical protein